MVNKTINLIHGRFYGSLRVAIIKNPRVLRLVQILRQVITLGPLNRICTLFYQKFGNNQPLQLDNYPLLPNLDVDAVVKSINDIGYSPGGIVEKEYLAKILEFCENNRPIRNFRQYHSRYHNPHRDCETINRLAYNKKIIEVVRKYLGAEPILWLTELKWTFPFPDKNIVYSPDQESAHYYGEAVFHNDLLDYKSLSVFVYLSDVDVDSSPHTFIKGTHKNKNLKELINRVISDTEARKKYGERIQSILGEKGSLFFEEITTYHKAQLLRKKSRLILHIDYVLQRRVLPEHQ